jgi:hypothetical protein
MRKVHLGIHGTFWDHEISKNQHLDGINDDFIAYTANGF